MRSPDTLASSPPILAAPMLIRNAAGPAGSKRLLAIADLYASYWAAEVLHGISMHVDEGEFVCVIGANTAGKSTLLRAISGLGPSVRGSIQFDGIELTKLRPHAIPALGIAHVPEGRHVFPQMSVEENLGLGAYPARKRAKLGERLERIYAVFPKLKERRHQLAGTLSGGEQQMVAAGRALMLEPRLLILDEPSHGLAPVVVEGLHRALVEIHGFGTSILLVEQNTALALAVASRGYVLQGGRIVLEETAEALLSDDSVRIAYLGA
jgi:branched-chain amino acid transport system ATP-binding protein